MSIATFIPEVWSKKLLSHLHKSHVFAGSDVVNTDYEGEISDAGDTVKINSVSRPTISPYSPGVTTITPEQLTTAQRSLTVDQAQYFAFEVDDVDKRQAAGDVMSEALKEAGYGLRDVADIYLEALMRAGVAGANQLGTVALAEANPEKAYDDLLIPLSVLLDEADVPREGRFIVIPPWVHGRLRRDDRFISAEKAGSSSVTAAGGVVGRAEDFTVKVSNNLPIITGDDSSVIAGHRMATSFAEQINKTEAYRPEDSFSDAVKGLHVYGAKVVRPTALATAAASKT